MPSGSPIHANALPRPPDIAKERPAGVEERDLCAAGIDSLGCETREIGMRQGRSDHQLPGLQRELCLEVARLWWRQFAHHAVAETREAVGPCAAQPILSPLHACWAEESNPPLGFAHTGEQLARHAERCKSAHRLGGGRTSL